jgi:sugar lactone lactonase YvrE
VLRFTAALVLAALPAVFVASAQDFTDIRIERVAAGLRFAEGPVWSLEGFLLFSDTPANTLNKFIPGKGTEPADARAGGPSGNAFDEQGRLYTCEVRERRVVRVDKKGKIDVIASQYQGKRLNAPDDIVVRRDGVAYFTDPAFGTQQDHRELDFYGVYRVSAKGEMEAIAKWKTRPNGVALAPNGRILYVTDSDARNVRAFDLDRGGAASNERVIVASVPGVPGGIRTDEKGNLWVAGKHVYVYSAQGRLLHTVELGETPSNLAFGDSDFETLYITAGTSVFRIRPGVKGALPYAP